MEVLRHNNTKNKITDKSIKNSGIINGDVNTGKVITKEKNNSKAAIIAAILSSIILSLGAIIAAYIK